MGELFFFGFLIIIAIAVVRAALANSQPPQVIYVQAVPDPAEGSGGCLSIILIVVLFIILIGMAQGMF